MEPSSKTKVILAISMAWFYGLDTSLETNPILDALHIYDVASVVNKEKPSLAQIVWTEDSPR